MSRKPRIDPELYDALKQNIQSLENTATSMPLPEGTRPTTMKNRILRVAAELGLPITIWRVPGGLIFWRSTDEDLHQATAVTHRMQTSHIKGRLHSGRRRASRAA